MRGCSVASRPERRIEAPRCTSNTTQPKREQEAPFSTAPLGQLTTQPESRLDPSPRSPPLGPLFAPTTRRIADRLTKFGQDGPGFQGYSRGDVCRSLTPAPA